MANAERLKFHVPRLKEPRMSASSAAALWPMGRLTGPTSVNFLRWVGKLPTHRRSPTRARRHPAKALLAALGSCLSIGIHANAVARAIPIRHLEIEIAGEIGVAALSGTGDLTPKPRGFETITVRVRIEADVSYDILEALLEDTDLEDTDMWSPLANTLHNPVHLDVVKK